MFYPTLLYIRNRIVQWAFETRIRMMAHDVQMLF